MAKKSAVKTKTAKKPAKKKPVKKPTLTARFGAAAAREIHKWKSLAKRLEFDV